MNTPVSLMDDQMVDMAFITQLTGLTDKWFYKLIKDGAFPAPIKLGRSSRWLKSEVEALVAGAYCTIPSVIPDHYPFNRSEYTIRPPEAFCCVLKERILCKNLKTGVICCSPSIRNGWQV